MGWEWMHPLPQGTRLSELLSAWCRANGILWTAGLPVPTLPWIPPHARTPEGLLLGQLNVAVPGTYLHVLHPSLHGTAIAQERFGQDPAGLIALERVADWELGRSALLKAELARRGVTTVRWDALAAA